MVGSVKVVRSDPDGSGSATLVAYWIQLLCQAVHC